VPIAIFLSLCLTLWPLSATFSGGHTSALSSGVRDLALQLSPERTQYVVGQPVRVNFEIRNESGHDIYVGRRIPINNNWPQHIEIWLEDRNGTRCPGLLVAGEPARPNPGQELSSAISERYLQLPAGYRYGAVITIDEYVAQCISKPGKYKIRAKYVSLDMPASLASFNPALASSNDLSTLSDKDWHGEVDATPVSVEIVKRLVQRPTPPN
jgi:hypothetical protein